jgi:hypothetical protein
MVGAELAQHKMGEHFLLESARVTSATSATQRLGTRFFLRHRDADVLGRSFLYLAPFTTICPGECGVFFTVGTSGMHRGSGLYIFVELGPIHEEAC